MTNSTSSGSKTKIVFFPASFSTTVINRAKGSGSSYLRSCKLKTRTDRSEGQLNTGRATVEASLQRTRTSDVDGNGNRLVLRRLQLTHTAGTAQGQLTDLTTKLSLKVLLNSAPKILRETYLVLLLLVVLWEIHRRSCTSMGETADEGKGKPSRKDPTATGKLKLMPTEEELSLPSLKQSVLDDTSVIPVMKPQEVATHPKDVVNVYNRLRVHLLDNDRNTILRFCMQGKQLKVVKETLGFHGKLLEILWAEYFENKMKLSARAGPVLDGDTEELNVSAMATSDALGRVQVPTCKSDRNLMTEKHPVAAEEGIGNITPPLKKACKPPPGLVYSAENSGWITGDQIPRNIALKFRPPPGMKFLSTELAVVAYIFAKGQNMREVLFPGEHVVADREAFMSLYPRRELTDDYFLKIINVVATMLTVERESSTWFLPTTFSRMALNPAECRKEILDYVVSRYMRGYVDEVQKIYVPMYQSGHWYLMVVEMSWPTNNDSGVWVAQWMQTTNIWRSYDVPFITNEHRMRLACDLVMTKANKSRQEICMKAASYWDAKVKGLQVNEDEASSDSLLRRRNQLLVSARAV
ncbi:hypothetical protein PIB30_077191 [Stylosanthes scabra]|uniref:Ubiquitin-like protease family profile domain-containing protein n=1 Tax=Stylosanthes scabra TaxID=79078 RepID=A0ABU6YPI8_9FABA|nr:hypothetical protein [Stylosanthes scabra]